MLIALTVVSAGLALAGARTDFLRTVERRTVDLRFRLLGDQGIADREIVLVAIDDASLKTLEPAVGRWPWPRSVHAELLRYLQRAGARAVVFDLLFTERDAADPEADADLARMTADSETVVHSIALGAQQTAKPDADLLAAHSLPRSGDFDSFIGAQLPLPAVARAARGLGHVTAALDADGPWRRYLLLAGHGDRLLPSLALTTALTLRDLDIASLGVGEREVVFDGIPIPLDRDWRLPIWFNGGAGTYQSYSYGQLFYSELQLRAGHSPGLDPQLFAGKVVLVGLAASGLHDLFTTPFSGGRGASGSGLGKMHGFEIHAHVLDSLLNGRFLQAAPWWQAAALCLLVGALALALILYCNLALTIPGLLTIPAVYLGLVQWDFSYHYALPVVPVITSWLLAAFAGLAYQYGIESAEKRRVKRIFSRYVSPTVFRELLDNPAAAKLGGTRRQMTVLFSDLRGFTSFSENRRPEEVIDQLNEYFAAMVEVVFAHRGTVDKFVGDMIMALFGAPLDDPLHADHAVQCARAMQRRLRELNLDWRRRGRPELKSGVGINSGEMVAGNLGSEQIQSYTVIGDSVNLGARIESLCKDFDAEILISEATKNLLESSAHVRELGEVAVKGKSRPVTLFQVSVDD